MKSLSAWALSMCLLSQFAIPQPLQAAEPEVSLVQGKESVKVLIGKDVFTVFRYGTERRKPFFLPVTGPGGYELLKAAVEGEKEDSLARRVFVASEEATLTKDGKESGKAHYGDLFEVSKVDGDKLWIEEKQGWIAREDIAPIASTVVRLINDAEPPSKDLVFGDKYDHPHHKGIWFSVDEINDIKFWMEASLVRTQSVDLVKAKGSSASMHFVNHWLDKEDKPVLLEATTVTFTPDRLLTYDTRLSPANGDVHIGDTKEGMFAIRLPGTMREDTGGGPVTSSEGLTGTSEAWGRTSRWVNYDGKIDGHVFGVTLMDAKQNPWKSRYHVRWYGLFAVNPFGAGAYTKATDDPQTPHERTLKSGEALHFKFGAWIHGPGVDVKKLNSVYKKFTGK